MPLWQQQQDQKQQQHGKGYNGRHQQRLNLDSVSRYANQPGLRGVLDPMPPHQQPVAVDAVGGAGHQGAVILPFGDLQRRLVRVTADAVQIEPLLVAPIVALPMLLLLLILLLLPKRPKNDNGGYADEEI